MSETLVKVENVSKKFCRDLKRSLWYGMQDLGREITGRQHGGDGELRTDEFWAVKDVSFELKRGECIGLIGRNGAGKTTLLRMLNGLIKPDQGRIEMKGSTAAMIALGAGFNPILTGRENIYVNASILGINKAEIDSKIEEIIEFSELSEFMDMPVQSYSSGMQVRLGFSIATALKPDILILDEILAVGDAAFKMKAYARIGSMLQNAAVIFVTHSMTQLYRICDVAGVMNNGRLTIHPSISSAIGQYYSLHETHSTKGDIQVCHQSIDKFKYTFTTEVRTKQSWSLQISIEVDTLISTGLAIVNFTSQEGFLAAEYREEKPIGISTGKNILIDIELYEIPLKSGKYHFDFALYSKDRKQPLVHVSNAGPVNVVNEILTEAICSLNGKLIISHRNSY